MAGEGTRRLRQGALWLALTGQLALSGCWTAAPRGGGHRSPAEAEPIVILPAGDSNTVGAGNPAGTAIGSEMVGYRKKLKELLAAAGVAVDFVGSQAAGGDHFADAQHEGYPGQGLAKLQARVDAGMLEQYSPDIVLLLVGSNDMWTSVIEQGPIADAQAHACVDRLAALLDDIVARRPQTQVIVANPATPASARRPLAIYRTGVERLVASRAAQGRRVRLVDLMGAANDGVHYTAAGHEECARRWRDAIMPLVAGIRQERGLREPAGAVGTADPGRR